MTRSRLVRHIAGLLIAVAPAPALAQACHTTPIKILVPFATGSAIDTLGRLFGECVASIGLEPAPSSSEEPAARLKVESTRWAKAVKEAGIVPE